MRHPIKCPKPFLSFRLREQDGLTGVWTWHKKNIWVFYFFPLDYSHVSFKNLNACITKKITIFDFFYEYKRSQKIFYVRELKTFSNIVWGRPRKFYPNFVFWNMIWTKHIIKNTVTDVSEELFNIWLLRVTAHPTALTKHVIKS